MIKVGLVGEDPNDTNSIKNLLSRSFEGRAQFIPLLKRVKGHQLDNRCTANSLAIELRNRKPDIVVFIRDADCIRTEEQKINDKIERYKNLSKAVAQSNILLLNIFELEALILADIGTFNRLYKTTINYGGDVTMQEKPKELLREKTWKLPKTYEEYHCPEIFKELDIDTVQNRCGYFREFMIELNRLLAA